MIPTLCLIGLLVNQRSFGQSTKESEKKRTDNKASKFHVPTLRNVDIGSLRKRQISSPLKPFAPIIDLSFKKTPEDYVEGYLADGWAPQNEEAISLTPPIDWLAFKEQNRSFNFKLHSWDPLVPFAIVLSEKPDSETLAFALAIVSDWIAKNPLPENPSRNGAGSFAWYDMAVGLRTAILALLFDVACRDPSITDQTIHELWGSLVDHFEYLDNDRLIAFHSNHGIFQAAGQLSAAKRLHCDQRLQVFKLQAINRLNRMLQEHFTSEGVHREHSPSYHFALLKTFSTLRQAGLTTELKNFDRLFLKMQNALAWMILPDGKLLNFGDTDSTTVTESDLTKFRWTSPILHYAVSCSKTGEPSESVVGAFPQSGHFAVHTGLGDGKLPFSESSFLALQCAFHSRTHKHADDLSLFWFDAGIPLLVDAGRYGYLGRTKTGSDLWQDGYYYADPNRVFVESTRAHNTIQIDDRNHQRRGTRPYESALQQWNIVDGITCATASVLHYRTIRHIRTIVFHPKEWLLVLDRVQDSTEKTHDIKQWFQLGPALHYDSARSGQLRFKIDGKDDRLWVTSLTEKAKYSMPIKGVREPVMQGWWSPKGLEMEPIWSFHFGMTDDDAKFVTLLSIGSSPLKILKTGDDKTTTKTQHYSWMNGDVKETVTIDYQTAVPTVSYKKKPGDAHRN